MRKQVVTLLGLLAVAIAVSFLVPQRAAAADDDDPPSRIARLSYASGNVSFEPAGTDDWVSYVLNRPITTGDKLWSDNGGRAELHMDSAVIRLSSNTGFSFLNLDDNTTQVRLTEGTINIRVRHLDQDETFEVDTPNLAFSILREGNYKIDVNENGDTTVVTVRNGQGEVTGGGSAYTVHANEIGTFAGVDQLDADIQGYGDQGDDFDRFCSDRDRREDRSQSSRYVSSDVIGYEDLDENGGWRPTPEYGNVWFPHTTIVGWAPYRYGHWAWVSPWGWTWVDDASWGFAPFHYGRWVTVAGVWGWVPCAPRSVVGVAYVRPVYAPALVAWVGGPRFGVGVSVGGGGGVGAGVAWFPLGPREVFVPSYHVSRTYVTRVNVSNTTVNTTVVNNYYNNVVVNKNVTNITYVNQRAPNAVTATSSASFTSAQPVGRNMIRVDRREVETAQVNVSAPAVAPQQRSVLGSGAAATARPPARLQERAVVAKTAPPPAPVSFVRQQQAIQANGGRPPAISQTREIQAPNTAQPRSNIRLAPVATPGTPGNRDGRARPGEQRSVPNRPGQQPAPATNVPNNANRPPAPNASQPPAQPPVAVPNNTSRPPQAVQPVQPNTPPPNVNRDRPNNDRPDRARPDHVNPTPPPNPQRDLKEQQQEQQLRQKQDQERQKVEQKQVQEQQKVDQKNADDRRRQAVDQKQQQQLQQLEQKHNQEQQKLQQKQQQDRQKDKPAAKPAKPPKDKKEKDDKPPHG